MPMQRRQVAHKAQNFVQRDTAVDLGDAVSCFVMGPWGHFAASQNSQPRPPAKLWSWGQQPPVASNAVALGAGAQLIPSKHAVGVATDDGDCWSAIADEGLGKVEML